MDRLAAAEVADGSRKQELAERPPKRTRRETNRAVRNTGLAVATAFNAEKVGERLESAERTTEIPVILRDLAQSENNSLLGNTNLISNRLPTPRRARNEFSPFFDQPPVPSSYVYDFESRDLNDARSSPEGRLLDDQ